jgi:hypothetical protein
MAPGPVWRVVAGAEADAIDDAVAAGHPYLNRAPTVEAPGHRTCMLYAAVTCPYLSRPTARRGEDASMPGLDVVRGERRGGGGGLAGFDSFEFRYTDVVLFRFTGLFEYRRHELGEEHLDELADAVALETGDPPEIPAYLLSDEDSATRRFQALLQSAL